MTFFSQRVILKNVLHNVFMYKFLVSLKVGDLLQSIQLSHGDIDIGIESRQSDSEMELAYVLIFCCLCPFPA